MTFQCQRCGKPFHSNADDPNRCGKCGSYVWDIPKDEVSPHRCGLANPNRKRTERVNE